MRLNRPDPAGGLSAEDAPEEFARRALIDALARAIWIFGVDPDCILVGKLRQALDVLEPACLVRPPRVDVDDIEALIDRLLNDVPATEWHYLFAALHDMLNARQASVGIPPRRARARSNNRKILRRLLQEEAR